MSQLKILHATIKTLEPPNKQTFNKIYKTLLRETEEDLDREVQHTYSETERLLFFYPLSFTEVLSNKWQFLKMSILPKLSIDSTHFKIWNLSFKFVQRANFVLLDKLIIKLILKCKVFRIAKTILKTTKLKDLFNPFQDYKITLSRLLPPKWPLEQNEEYRNRPTNIQSTDN